MGESLSFGELMRDTLHEKNYSLRKLGRETGLDIATLSRLMNDKQKPNMHHLEKLAKALDISLNGLLEAAGYDVNPEKKAFDKILHEKDVHDQDIFEVCTHIENPQVRGDIERELDKYSQYMTTEEGNQMIRRGFEQKLKSVGQIGPIVDLLKQLYSQYCQVDLKLATAILIGSGLLYFIISPDVIPDFIFPLGFIDDVIAIKIILAKLGVQ